MLKLLRATQKSMILALFEESALHVGVCVFVGHLFLSMIGFLCVWVYLSLLDSVYVFVRSQADTAELATAWWVGT